MNERVNAAVRRFVAENFLHRDADARSWDTVSLLGAGAIDSVNVLELILWLESTFAIEVRDPEIVPENLDSIVAITGYVERKLGRRRERVA
jgi:acyl carrier protein